MHMASICTFVQVRKGALLGRHILCQGKCWLVKRSWISIRSCPLSKHPSSTQSCMEALDTVPDLVELTEMANKDTNT